MATKHINNQPFRRRRRSHNGGATDEDIAVLIERFGVPAERLRVHLPLPFWLVRFAGYPEPPAPLRLLPGRGSDDNRDATRNEGRSSPNDRAPKGGAIIIAGTNNVLGKWSVNQKSRRPSEKPTR